MAIGLCPIALLLPYGHITVIDPAWKSGSGGMEYPTLFTAGTRLFNPEGGGRPEGVTIHEAGHQFWYGLVGNNEFEHAWIDEGLNTFSTARVADVEYDAQKFVERYLGSKGLPRRACSGPGSGGHPASRSPLVRAASRSPGRPRARSGSRR